MGCQKSVLLMLLTATLCCAQEHVYCGRSLARAIAAICYHENNDNLGKRAEGTMYNAILSPYYKNQDPQYGWMWPSHKTRALSLPSRGKRPVVNECCDKPCTLNELLSYCDY